MRRTMLLGIGAISWLALVGCGGTAALTGNDAAAGGAAGAMSSGGTSGNGGAGPAMRVPKNHRAAGAACSQDRPPGAYVDMCAPDAIPATSARNCVHDEECVAGANGRCAETSGPIRDCRGYCTYDACFGDADCAAHEPCDCRAVAALPPAANTCVKSSNCAVDADCGSGAFCSPSLVGDLCFCPSTALCTPSDQCFAGSMQVPCVCGDSCGHAYYCHGAADECVDDDDCAQGTCNFDTLAQHWTCADCWPVI